MKVLVILSTVLIVTMANVETLPGNGNCTLISEDHSEKKKFALIDSMSKETFSQLRLKDPATKDQVWDFVSHSGCRKDFSKSQTEDFMNKT